MNKLLKTTFMAMLLLSGSYLFAQPAGGGGGQGQGGQPPGGGVGAPVDEAAAIFLLSVACYTYYQLGQKKQPV